MFTDLSSTCCKVFEIFFVIIDIYMAKIVKYYGAIRFYGGHYE